MKQFISQLKQSAVLTRDDARNCFEQLFETQVEDQEIAELLTLFNARPYESEELLGFLDYLSTQSNPCILDADSVFDVCGTGGDGKNTINISTLSAFILAAMGEKVAKHGNYSASSSVGSSNLLEALSIPLVDDALKAQQIFSKVGIVFLHAPLWHPRLKKVAVVRKKLGFRTVFNLLGPLLNPAHPKFQMIGAPSSDIAKLITNVQLSRLAETGKKFAAISDHNGYDEISLTGTFSVYSSKVDTKFQAYDFGTEPVEPKSLELPSTLEETVAVSKRLLAGLGTKEHESVIAANVALALSLRYPERSLSDHFKNALETIRSGSAMKTLNALRSFA